MWRLAGGWPGIGVALGLFLGTRLVQLGLIGWMLSGQEATLRQKLLVWDAGWFMNVATEGYPDRYTYDGTGEMVGNGLAFFPLFPSLIRFVMLFGVPVSSAAITVAWIAGAAAAVAVYLLGTSLYGRRVGYALLLLCTTQPMSVVLSLAYSEGLFLALVAGMLLAAHRRAWIVAGALGLAAALTRPTGIAAGIALLAAAAVVFVEDRGGGGTAQGGGSAQGRPRRERWIALGAAAVALAGVPAYLLWVGLRVGEPDAWFKIQSAGWGTAFDLGNSTIIFVMENLRAGEGFVPVSVAWLLVAAVVVTLVALTMRVWPPLVAYGLIALIMVVGQGGYYHSKPRLLVPVLLTLVPLAVAAGRASPRAAAVGLSVFGAFGLWYGAYLVTVWPYTI